MRVLFPGGIEIFGNVCFCGGKTTREPGEKPSEQDKNQQQTQPTCDACSLGPFLEGLEKFSHPESRCKTLWLQSRFIHILLIWTELRSLYTRSLRHRIHLSDFRYRLIKNGPKSFRGFLVRESKPGHIGRRGVLSPLRQPLPSPAPPCLLHKILDFIILFVYLLIYFLNKYFLVQFSVLWRKTAC